MNLIFVHGVIFLGIGKCVGVQDCPFQDKVGVAIRETREAINSVARMNDFLDRVPRYHRDRGHDIIEYTRRNAEELDRIMGGMRAIPQDNPYHKDIQRFVSQLEVVKEYVRRHHYDGR